MTVEVAPGVCMGGDALVLIAGPCVIESEGHAVELGGRIAERAAAAGVGYIFKASFDKANRTSIESYRGPGLDAGVKILEKVKAAVGCPVTTDVHEAHQAAAVAEVADVIQIPALLCRQTDLLVAAGATGRVVNVKKGQFTDPRNMRHAVDKVRSTGNHKVVVTERGTSFGYGNLVVDMRSLPLMHEACACPVVMDATHAVQLPGAGDGRSTGERRFIRPLARAAAAVGIDGLFLEVHDRPDEALSDGPNALPLAELDALLGEVVPLHSTRRAAGE